MKKTLKIDEKTSQKWYKNEVVVKIAFSTSKNRRFSSKNRFSVDFWKFTRPPGGPQEAQNRPWKKNQKKKRVSEFPSILRLRPFSAKTIAREAPGGPQVAPGVPRGAILGRFLMNF